MFFFYSISAFGQVKNFFLIKGVVKNLTASVIEVSVSSFMNHNLHILKINSDGSFEQFIPVKGTQDISLDLAGHPIEIHVSDGDTLEINWDENDFENTFRLSSPNTYYRKALQILQELNIRSNPRFARLQKMFYSNELKDTAKYNVINGCYNEDMRIISKYQFSHAKIIYDTFFKYVTVLSKTRLQERFQLKLVTELDTNRFLKPIFLSDLLLSEPIYQLSPVYRDYIYDRIRFLKPFAAAISVDPAMKEPFNPVKDEYRAGEAFLSVLSIREWFLAKSIITNFSYYDFDQCKEMYDRYLGTYPNSQFSDSLRKFFKTISRLRPGNLAPGFTLRDINNKEVSLKNFIGKVIYIDFWGVHCPPCINDIQKNAALVHNKYQSEDVVFINICVDATENKWKQAVKSLRLNGVNLLAKDWTTNTICTDYNIKGIPHYVLIGRDGKIIKNNAPWLYELLGEHKNVLDDVL